MKRIFTIIIVLISISLLGIIYIQFNWITNVVKVKEEQYGEKVKMALQRAGQKILNTNNEINASQILKDFQFNLLQDNNGRKNFLSNLTGNQIAEIIRKSFQELNVNVPKFEFSVSSNVNDGTFFKPEVHSIGFNKLREKGEEGIQYPIIPESGSVFESLVSDGNIWVIIPNSKITLLKEMSWMIAGALLFTIIIISAFYLTVRTMLKQKKISEIKSDFINNMTHEFKTPIATISLAVDALKNEKVIGNVEKTNYFTGVIKEENKRMNKQVESILQAALLDKQELQLNLRNLHVNEIVQNAYDHFKIMLEQNNGTAELILNANPDTIKADEVHITNLVRNLMDNAIKYSKPDLPVHLKITTSCNKKVIQFQIEDNGIGMNKETSSRVFEKFYRAHTGNVHNVKGFGLGLTYVKAVVDAHEGKIKVDSTLGKGSTFIVELPLITT
jgi:two-component system, OmpR family, phosphate regulon sensor histidine kinase PhoR